jgi:ribosomal protein L7/L12
MGILEFFTPERQRIDQLSRQLVQMERKVDLILDHLGLEFVADDALAEVRRMLDEGRKVDAVKAYRELYPGMGLREAKEKVEALQGR